MMARGRRVWEIGEGELKSAGDICNNISTITIKKNK